MTTTLNRTFSVAPMMDCTDRHCRYFYRTLTQETLLYTEMVVSSAILKGNPKRFLSHSPKEYPLALQLGGSHAGDLAKCSAIAEEWGYQEVNLNVGCPSDRVQAGMIGACLMGEPDLVAECVGQMKSATSLPVTVKTRIGIDHQDDYQFLKTFVEKVSNKGCTTFIIHARKAWLHGLSPKENRTKPPLHPERVFQLKQDFPQLEIIFNGGLLSLSECEQVMPHVDGVMVGRGVYDNPGILYSVDTWIEKYTSAEKSTPIALDSSEGDSTHKAFLQRKKSLEQYLIYAHEQLVEGVPLSFLVKPITHIFHGMSGAKKWRQALSEANSPQGGGIPYILEYLNNLEN